MTVKAFLEGAKFPEYQHFVVMSRESCGMVSLGGGGFSSVLSRFGEKEIKGVSVYEGMLRIEV